MYTFFSRLWARGQEELKPAGLRRRSAVGAASKRGARARTAPAAPCPPFSLLPGTPRPLPAEFRQAREPGDAHAALRPGAGASRAPAQRAPLSSASTRVRRRVRSSFRTGAGGGRSAQALLPRTPARSAVSPRRGWKEMANSPATPTATPGDGEFPLRWRLAPPRTRKSPRPAGQGFLVKERQLGRWET